MELEEAIKILTESIIQKKYHIFYTDLEKAIETVLKELEDKNKRIYYLENEARRFVIQEIDKHKIEIYKSYVPKKKIEDTIKEIKSRNYNDFTDHQDGNEIKYRILFEFQEFIEK